MADTSAKIQKAIDNAGKLLMIGGLTPAPGDATDNASIAEFFDAFPKDYAEHCGGRKSKGSPESILASYGKAVKALMDLEMHLTKAVPHAIDELTPKPGSSPTNVENRFPRKQEVCREKGRDAMRTNAIACIPTAKALPKNPKRGVTLLGSESSFTAAAKFLFVTCSIYMGLIGLVMIFNPGLWIDVIVTLGKEVIMAVPNYMHYVSVCFIERIKQHVIDNVINLCRWLVGLSPTDSTSWYVIPPKYKPQMPPTFGGETLLLAPISVAALLITVGGAYVFAMIRVWRFLF